MRLPFIALCVLALPGCHEAAKPVAEVPATPPPAAAALRTAHLTVTTQPNPDHTFGYDLRADGQLLIHQPSIPAQPGNAGFRTAQAAQKVGNLVAEKLRRGQLPPSVTKAELDSLGVL